MNIMIYMKYIILESTLYSRNSYYNKICLFSENKKLVFLKCRWYGQNKYTLVLYIINTVLFTYCNARNSYQNTSNESNQLIDAVDKY